VSAPKAGHGSTHARKHFCLAAHHREPTGAVAHVVSTVTAFVAIRLVVAVELTVAAVGDMVGDTVGDIDAVGGGVFFGAFLPFFPFLPLVFPFFVLGLGVGGVVSVDSVEEAAIAVAIPSIALGVEESAGAMLVAWSSVAGVMSGPPDPC